MQNNTSFRIKEQQISYLFAALPSAFISILSVILIALFMLQEYAETTLLYIWTATNIFILGLRFLLFLAYKRAALTPNNINLFYLLFTVLTLMTALSLGSSALYILPKEIFYQVSLLFMIVALSAGASISLAPKIKLFYIYVLFILSPYVFIFLLSDENGSDILALMLMLYMGILAQSAKKTSQSINQNIELAYNNEQLILQLQKETKIANEQKEKAQEHAKAKSKFLANTSHELRTPLNAIIGFSQILARSETLPKKEQSFIKKINLSGEHLLKLINSVLDFSKLEAGQLELEHEKFDLYSVVHNVLAQFSSQATKKKVTIRLEYPDSLPHIFIGDSLRISQVLTNLIANALKFTEQGEISVLLRESENERIHFEIQDSGIGLTQEEISKLFQAFSQSNTNTAKLYGGTGLGLAISKEIITKMNGTIWIESQKGIGSNFIFEIQLKEEV